MHSARSASIQTRIRRGGELSEQATDYLLLTSAEVFDHGDLPLSTLAFGILIGNIENVTEPNKFLGWRRTHLKIWFTRQNNWYGGSGLFG